MGKETTWEHATIGGGCFWCLEAVYEGLPGIHGVVSGYAGGTTPDPTYELVCTGTTGHAEVVRIAYDPSVTSYAKILETFWEAGRLQAMEMALGVTSAADHQAMARPPAVAIDGIPAAAARQGVEQLASTMGTDHGDNRKVKSHGDAE